MSETATATPAAPAAAPAPAQPAGISLAGAQAQPAPASAPTQSTPIFGGHVDESGAFREGWTESIRAAGFETLAGKLQTAKDEKGVLSILDNAIKTASRRELKGPPNEGWADHEVAEFRRAYGIPEEAQAYKLKPENLPDGICETKACGYFSRPLARADWQRLIDYFATSPNTWSMAYLEPYGGAINRYPVSGSAFIHRDADADLVVDVFWRTPEERAQTEAWLDGFMQLAQPFLNGHVYQNYPDSRLQDFTQAYWGDAYPELQAVKALYDPTNFFRFEQSIRLP